MKVKGPAGTSHRRSRASEPEEPALDARAGGPAAPDLLAQLQHSAGNAATAALVDRAPILRRQIDQGLLHHVGEIVASGSAVAGRPPRPAVDGGSPTLVVQRAIDAAVMTGADAILAQVQVPNGVTPKGTGTVPNVVVVPDEGFAGAGGNPAVAVANPLQVNLYKNLVLDKRDQYAADVDVDTLAASIVKGTIVIKENAARNYGVLLKSAILWHEYGHFIYQLGAGHTGDVYQFEVDCLTAHQGTLGGAQAVANFLAGRINDFKSAKAGTAKDNFYANFNASVWGQAPHNLHLP
jgi:hypothetical protein